MYRPAARTVELEHAATCVCVARFEDDDAESADWSAVGDASDARGRTAPSSSDPLASSGDAVNAGVTTQRVAGRSATHDVDVEIRRRRRLRRRRGRVRPRGRRRDGRSSAASRPSRVKAIAAVTAATVAPPSPEDETFWRAGETTTRDDDDDASSEPTPKASDAANAETSDANDEHEGTRKEEGAEEKERDADDPENDPVVPLCATSRRRGGRDAARRDPATFVAAACEDAARVYALGDARASRSSKRFTPLVRGVHARRGPRRRRCGSRRTAGRRARRARRRLARVRGVEGAEGGGVLAAHRRAGGGGERRERARRGSRRGRGRRRERGRGRGRDDTNDARDREAVYSEAKKERRLSVSPRRRRGRGSSSRRRRPPRWLAAASPTQFGAAFPEAPRVEPGRG